MYIVIELIIAMTIMGYLNYGMSSQMTVISQLGQQLEERNEEENMNNLKRGALNYYEINGVLPNTIDDIKGYMEFNTISGNIDKYNQFFEIVKNSNDTSFKFNGSIANYSFAIVSKGANQTLETNIDSNNTLLLDSLEKAQLISLFELNNTKRGITKEKINRCSIAYETYYVINGGNPGSIYDLITSGDLNSIDSYDSYGQILLLDGVNHKCYSKGFNQLDNNKTIDDIY